MLRVFKRVLGISYKYCITIISLQNAAQHIFEMQLKGFKGAANKNPKKLFGPKYSVPKKIMLQNIKCLDLYKGHF